MRRNCECGRACPIEKNLLRDMDEAEPRVGAGMSGGAEPV